MRIAVLPYTIKGGLSTYALELSEALAERGLDVTLLGVGGVVCNEPLQYKAIPHIKELDRLREPMLWNAVIGASASSILQSSSVDIVHCVYPALAPFISTHETIVSSGWFSPHNLWSRLAITMRMSQFSIAKLSELYGQAGYYLLDELGYVRSECIFAVTRTLEVSLRKRFGERVRYIPPGIKLPTTCIRRGKNDKVLIVCIAADLENPRKGVLSLLRALTFIKPSILEKAKFRLIGGYSDGLENEVRMLRHRGYIDIKLVGYIPRDKLLRYLLQTDLLICPSLYEEFGYVILEAMSAGIPIIATRIHPLTDIAVDGISGLFYEKDNAHELSYLISMLISDDAMRHKMGEEARVRVLNNFSWNLIAQKLENYYERILDESKPIDKMIGTYE